MIGRLYSWLTVAVQPLLVLKLRRRGKVEPGYLENVPERFGHYRQPPETVGQRIWIHAVSLGETRAAAVLIKALRQQRPDLRLLLTHGTATGRAEGLPLLREGDVQVWQPWDTPQATRRFLAHFRPALGVLMETEVWPNLMAQAGAAGVPMALVNARLSERSLRSALRWAALARPAYGQLSLVLAQSQADAQRLRTLGAPVQAVLGNLKFDADPDRAQCELGLGRRAALSRPVLMLASSREGEERALLQALSRLPRPWAFEVLIVPRHPQRFEEVAAAIEAHGFDCSRRSQWGADLSAFAPVGEGCIWLGNSMGEMAFYYSLASVALLGGSFAPLGGQNLIEAAACGCPVVMGPHTFNFAEVAEQALAEGAAWRAEDWHQALQRASDLLGPDHGEKVTRAREFALRHQGAARSSVGQLLALLHPAASLRGGPESC
jgi:3-deoxy-D-manno-octulosonic-acid transferase